MNSNSNLFSIKQIPIKGNTSLNLSKVFTFSKKQLDADGSIPSQTLVKNSIKDISSKFKKHKESAESAQALSKAVFDQEAKIAEIREAIRQQKNQIAEKKTENYLIINSLKNEIANLEKEEENYKHNSIIRMKKREKEIQKEFEKIRSHQLMSIKESRKQLSNITMALSQHENKQKQITTSRISSHLNTIEDLQKSKALGKQNLLLQLQSQHNKQVNEMSQSLMKIKNYSEKIQNLSKEESILKQLFKRYTKNNSLITSIQHRLLKRQNASKLLMTRNQLDWRQFPILESFANTQNSFYSTIKTGYSQLLRTAKSQQH